MSIRENPPECNPRYYAQLPAPDGEYTAEGQAQETAEGWIFYLNDIEPLPMFFTRHQLVLLGEVRVSDEQRRSDGDYARKVCGY